MRLLRILPHRWHQIAREATKFAVIGGINTAVDLIIWNALLAIGPLKAKIVSTVVATTLSYLMNRYWTFAKRERSAAHREYVLFFGLNLVGLAIQITPIGIAKYVLDFSEHGTTSDRLAFNIANVLGVGIAMVFRFWSYRAFVFRSPKVAAAGPTNPPPGEGGSRTPDAPLGGPDGPAVESASGPTDLHPVPAESSRIPNGVVETPVAPSQRNSRPGHPSRTALVPPPTVTEDEIAEFTSTLEDELDLVRLEEQARHEAMLLSGERPPTA